MILKSTKKRQYLNKLLGSIAIIAGSVGLLFLLWIILEVLLRGITAFSFSFFTELPKPPGVEAESGLLSAILGTLVMIFLAAALALPIAVLGGIYLSESSAKSRYAGIVQYFLDIMQGTPTIIYGIAIYFVLVVPAGGFSGIAGALVLSIIMLPYLMNAVAKEMGRVPGSLREASYALGATRFKTIRSIVFRRNRAVLIVALLFIVVRTAGETAALIFTALNNTFWPGSLSEPYPNLTVTIYQYALSPFKEFQHLAWGASLLLTLVVLLVALMTHLVSSNKRR